MRTIKRATILLILLLSSYIANAQCFDRLPAFPRPYRYGVLNVATADFNLDGIMDVLAPEDGDDTLTIYYGNVNGSYDIGYKLHLWWKPYSYAKTIDIDNDSLMDVLILDKSNSGLYVYKGTGDPVTPITLYSSVGVSVSNPLSIEIADFNGDGHDDLAMPGGVDNIGIMFGDGTGNFAAANSFGLNTGRYLGGIACADVNGDGKDDIIASEGDGAKLLVILGNGAGDFFRSNTYTVGSSSLTDITAPILNDLDKDGHLDIIVGYLSNVWVYKGDGQGNFSFKSKYTTTNSILDLKLANINNDPYMDVVVSNRSNFAVLLGEQNASFTAPHVVSTYSADCESVVCSDLNNDGLDDLLLLIDFTYEIVPFINTGVSDFLRPYRRYATGPEPSLFFSFTSDRASHLFTCNDSTSSIYDRLTGFQRDGQGEMEFYSLGSYYSHVGYISDIMYCNIDNDINDLPDGILLDFKNEYFFIDHYGNDTSFYHLPVGSGPISFDTADVDQNGYLDLVVANYYDNSISIITGTDSGFTSISTIPVGNKPRSVSTADVNNDGYTDIAVANSGDNNITILLNYGAGNFSSANYTVGTEPVWVQFTKLNNSGIVDIAVVNKGSNNISILQGSGLGSFTNARNILVGKKPMSAAIGDIDKDGINDMVTANSGSNTITVMYGNGAGNFSYSSTYRTDTMPVSVALTDINENGMLDIVTANKLSNSLSVYYNDIHHNVDLGNDTTLIGCSSLPFTLDPGQQNNVRYFWNTGENTPTIEIENSGSYWVELSHYNGCMFDPQMAYIDITIDSCTNINEIEQSDFEIFPNPFSYQTTFRSAYDLSGCTLSIYNTMGKKQVSLTGLSSTTVIIDRDGLASGMYFVVLQKGQEILYTGKLSLAGQ